MTTPGDPGDPANSGQPAAAFFTQDQVNYFAAQAKRGALDSFFKTDLGLEKTPEGDELKAALQKAAEYDKQQNDQKPVVERLTTERDEAKAEAAKVPTLETQLTIAKMAADAGLKPKYWKFVEGKTDEEIKASIAEVLADFPSNGGGEEGGEGGGSKRPDPVGQQGQGQGKPPTKSLQSGAAQYAAKHKRETT